MRKQTVNTVNTRERGSITPGRAICKHQIQGVFTAQTHYTVPTYICSKVGGGTLQSKVVPALEEGERSMGVGGGGGGALFSAYFDCLLLCNLKDDGTSTCSSKEDPK